MTTLEQTMLPPPIEVDVAGGDLEELLTREWLLTNRIGAYASSTVVGCNTRRYHGLLVAATAPPMGRVTALSSLLERLVIDEQSYELATNEFDGAFAPRGHDFQTRFEQGVVPRFVFRVGEGDGAAELAKEVVPAESANAVAVRYTLRGGSGALHVRPLAALRDFHHLRACGDPGQVTYRVEDGAVAVEDRAAEVRTLWLELAGADFEGAPDWWYRFLYRADVARGQDGFEDLYTPGEFRVELDDGASVVFTASLDGPQRVDYDRELERRRRRLGSIVGALPVEADEPTRRLAMATDAFVVERRFENAPPSPTILAGYHWFADWGRDAFIALPGLLLETGRLDEARGVFRTFAGRIADGLVPNRFDDYSAGVHYNSIDASLWFIIAAERFCRAGGDAAFWRDTLQPAAAQILRRYREGTQFDIRADADLLLSGGSARTQLTWMDAKLGDEVVTPRHGKPVEVNALWHSAHRIVAARAAGVDDALAEECREHAELIAKAFCETFWDEGAGRLYDCVCDGSPDGSMRPNQILAVSLPYSPLEPERQRAVVEAVERDLLTPAGLRTLAPGDPRYRRRYGGSWESRDRAYHQGTVWAWLTGPFVEAMLKTAGAGEDPVEPRNVRPFARERAREILRPFDAQLTRAGLGYLSEIFDGDPPHAPRGCIAQAWSVAEVLRVRRLLARCDAEA